MNAQAALKGYASVQVDASVQAASSHRLIQMLYDGLLERIAQAKGAMQQKNIELKGQKINDAGTILLGLRDSLDVANGGEIAENLSNLYDYVQRSLVKAHMKNDEALLDECASLIGGVADAWRQIG